MKLLMMYFLTLFAFIILGTLVYSVYLNVTEYVAGSVINLFNTKDLLKSLFHISFCSLFFICPILSLYKIRHQGGVPQTIVYVFLVILTWGVFYPGLIYLEKFYHQIKPRNYVEQNLTGNYFRKSGDKVYYFTRNFYTDPINFDETTTIVIDTSEDGTVEVYKIDDTPDFDLYQVAAPYKDILIKNSFQKYVNLKLIDVKKLINTGKMCFMSGWYFYLGFCSLGILIASVFALCGLFNWRLLNVCFVFVTEFLIMSFNTLVRYGKFAVIIDKVWSWPFIMTLDRFFDNPVLVVVNVLCSLVFIVTGIVLFAVRNHKKRVAGN